MTNTLNLRARVIPWDDPGFVRAFEAARDQLPAEGLEIYGPRAAARAEQLLRQAGYPRARIDCERTPDEALAHAAHWTVHRDGPA